MTTTRFFVAYSPAACAYAVFDSSRRVEGNSTGFAILWGTDHPDRDFVQQECDKMNSDTDYVIERYGSDLTEL